MANRKARPAPTKTRAARASDDRLNAFAMQVGRTLGTMQSTADGLIDRRKVSKQIARIRDAANELLHYLGRGAVEVPAQARTDPNGRSGGKVDAPGKKHRRAPAARAAPGIRTIIPKRNVARETSRARRG